VVTYIVGHAPTEGADDKSVAACSDELSKLIGEVIAKCPAAEVLDFLEASGRMGSVASECVGSCYVDEESRNGAELRMLLE